MNADFSDNRSNDRGCCENTVTSRLRAMSLALAGLVAPGIAQSAAVTPQGASETAGQLPADLQALKEATFNMDRQHGRVRELVHGNNDRILNAEVSTAEQRDRQQQIGEKIVAACAETDALNVRAKSLGATAELAVELSKLQAFAPTSFSYTWYLTRYPDVAATGAQIDDKTGQIKVCGENFILAARHYLQSGQSEGRAPNPLFYPIYYCEHNPDVAKSCPVGVGLYEWALQHWQSVGAVEGRQGSPLLSAKYYLDENPDLQKVVGHDYLLATTHFVHRGLSELRAGSREGSALLKTKFSGLSAEGRRGNALAGGLDPVDVASFFEDLGKLLDFPATCAEAKRDILTCHYAGLRGCLFDLIKAGQICVKEDLQKAMEREAASRELKEMVDRMEREGGPRGYDRDVDRQNAAGERNERESKGGRMIA